MRQSIAALAFIAVGLFFMIAQGSWFALIFVAFGCYALTIQIDNQRKPFSVWKRLLQWS